MTKAFLLSLALLVPAATAALAADFTVPVDGDFSSGDLTWTGQGKSYEMLWTPTLIDGRIAVCGAGRFVTPHGRSQSQKILRAARVRHNGKVILSDVTFFTIVGGRDDLRSAKATCRLTDATPDRTTNEFVLEWNGVGRF
jgi:hypothetical protein